MKQASPSCCCGSLRWLLARAVTVKEEESCILVSKKHLAEGKQQSLSTK